jgi:hypothetical protein
VSKCINILKDNGLNTLCSNCILQLVDVICMFTVVIANTWNARGVNVFTFLYTQANCDYSGSAVQCLCKLFQIVSLLFFNVLWLVALFTDL